MIKALTVTQFIESVNLLINEYNVIVEGEISEFRVNQNKWVFFSIKDEASSVGCFMTVYQLKVPIEDGMQVRVYGYPKVYNKTGRFSLVVRKVEPAGEGALKRAYDLLKAKLEQEGLFAPERKRQIVRFPHKIGLITAKGSAAYSDFIKILKARFGGLEIHLVPAQVQGEKAVEQIVEAFGYFNQRIGYDAVILIRGGGSLEDLQAFNSEEVARAVFGSRFPVVCGVGHERDESLADFVADLRASTPSNAAELLVPHRREVEQELNYVINQWEQGIRVKVQSYQDKITEFKTVLAAFWQQFEAKKVFIAGQIERLPLLLNKLVASAKDQVEAKIRLLKSLDPQTVLRRGYSITYKDQRVVKTTQQLQAGDQVRVQLSRGKFDSKVKKIQN